MHRLASTIAASLCIGFHAVSAATLGPNDGGMSLSPPALAFAAHAVVTALAAFSLAGLHGRSDDERSRGELALAAALVGGAFVLLPSASDPWSIVAATCVGLLALLFDRAVSVTDEEDDDDAAFRDALALIAASAKAARTARPSDPDRR